MNYNDALAKYEHMVKNWDGVGPRLKTHVRGLACERLAEMVKIAAAEARDLFDKHCVGLGDMGYAHMLKPASRAVQVTKRGRGYAGVVLVEYLATSMNVIIDIIPSMVDPTKLLIKTKKEQVLIDTKDLVETLRLRYLTKWVNLVSMFGLISPPPVKA